MRGNRRMCKLVSEWIELRAMPPRLLRSQAEAPLSPLARKPGDFEVGPGAMPVPRRQHPLQESADMDETENGNEGGLVAQRRRGESGMSFE